MGGRWCQGSWPAWPKGTVILDDEGWWVETSTGQLIGIDLQTDRPILSEQEVKQWRNNARPFNEACVGLATSLQHNKVGRPKSDDPKQIITIRLDRDLLECLKVKAEGSGWQTRINAILRKATGLE
jgi:uncharacterized protein (DUF4415 family)